MTKEQKIHEIELAKTDALDARADFARLGMGMQVQKCNAFIAKCNAQLAKLRS